MFSQSFLRFPVVCHSSWGTNLKSALLLTIFVDSRQLEYLVFHLLMMMAQLMIALYVLDGLEHNRRESMEWAQSSWILSFGYYCSQIVVIITSEANVKTNRSAKRISIHIWGEFGANRTECYIDVGVLSIRVLHIYTKILIVFNSLAFLLYEFIDYMHYL